MEKKHKLIVLFVIYGIVIAAGLDVYFSFIHDKPKIAAENQAILTANQAVSGIKNFINSSQNNLNNSPIGLPKP